MTGTMKAIVMRAPGPPDSLKLEEMPIPEPAPGKVLIRVRARGINRSEMFTRQGHSPGLQYPRVLGIEACGEVVAAPSGEFAPGDVVASIMGGMGRLWDGGYAEYCLVPATQIQKITVKLDWATLGAMPEMLQTAHGSLFRSLQLKAGEVLLVRGGTTSVGLSAAALARNAGAKVISTSRSANRVDLLKANGASETIVDSGSIAAEVRMLYPNGVDKVLELIGTVTLQDSLRCTREGGIVCMTGIVGDSWTLNDLNPMDFIPTGVCLTSYADPNAFMKIPMNELAQQVADKTLNITIGRTLSLEEIPLAHELMESNKAGGKIVVLS
ncbi:uncharacterized protein L969DRAFT_20156 [Mixia osmundae IAM 14324]|uniref:Enoyl reductase (ER) domain-containing protein n=1 Tax=Mixia osmundae (strain CBS 9802 / IAM 14324 / JCM 22182 / KY 12970) TaxID=764103 RepID=G7E1V5_MIXOS|nr:uncharacterized protein L969DRAFT_20156 [Mixia osmundae IAM 14324]KEI36761.1 hypothetical protein L969DRAFT_20156 [Mixia osmundae IAM 14324]GAA96815.1 hypothetical protein E5Q_03487 [Mixia osmundae IAM 14324]